MNTISDHFPHDAAIDPTAPETQRADFAAIPAKAAVYLLTSNAPDHGDQPLLLATVGDLRAALKRRLADSPPDVKTKRVPYGTLCTRVHYRIVYSAFAANYYYAQAARDLFPQTAASLIPWEASWWLAVERPLPGASPFPHFRKTSNLSDPALSYAGPIRDKAAAQRLVETLEDLFDLCRYHHILVQAPHGKACAYKEMGKCPAPCDGTIPLSDYRAQINTALTFVANQSRSAWRASVEQQMKSAAASLQFETAAKIKQRLSRAAIISTEPYAAVARLEDFAFLTLQPGKGKPWIEPWLIHLAGGNAIQSLPQFNLKQLPVAAIHLADQCRFLAQSNAPTSLTPDQTLHAALVAHHLYKGDADHGIWLRLHDAQNPAAIIAAVEKLRARKAPKPMTERASDAVPSEACAK